MKVSQLLPAIHSLGRLAVANPNRIAVFILAAFFMVCVLSQRDKSVTVDEFSHFPAGLYNLTTRDWRMDRESPPLVKCLPGALTVNLTNPVLPAGASEATPNAWDFGYRFMYANFSRYVDIFAWGRVVIIALSCLGGWLVYAFSARLFGPWGGIVSLILYSANPNIIAHSQLVTIDAGASVFVLASVFLFWEFLARRTIPSAIAAGIGLGAAALSKFTALMLLPSMLLIVVATASWRAIHPGGGSAVERQTGRSSLLLFCLTLVICLATINAGYLFSGTFFTLRSQAYASDAMRWLAATPLSGIPLPLPLEYVSGFDAQLAISRGNGPFYRGYLMGEHAPAGWWYYYLVGLLVKNPEIIWGFAGLSLWMWIRSVPRPSLAMWLCLWGIPVVFIGYFSAGTNTPIGIRFLLPIFPLLFVAFGAIIRLAAARQTTGRMLVAVMLVLYSVPAFGIYPDYLSYFNNASGGPRNGHRWLSDSNIDWGQDLPAVKRYMAEHGIATIKLGYFGRVDPRIYGIDYTLADREIGEGLHAISVNFLVGRPYYLLEKGSLYPIGFDHYEAYRSLVPTAVLGNTMFLFSGGREPS